MHNHLYENEFNLPVNEISFSYEKMGTKPRFEEEAKGNSQMAYYACVCTETSENGIPLRHNTSTRMFTTRGYVCPVKTQSPDYLTPKQFGGFGWFSMCLCLRRISFSLASSLLLSFVLASLVKTRVNSPLFTCSE